MNSGINYGFSRLNQEQYHVTCGMGGLICNINKMSLILVAKNEFGNKQKANPPQPLNQSKGKAIPCTSPKPIQSFKMSHVSHASHTSHQQMVKREAHNPPSELQNPKSAPKQTG